MSRARASFEFDIFSNSREYVLKSSTRACARVIYTYNVILMKGNIRAVVRAREYVANRALEFHNSSGRAAAAASRAPDERRHAEVLSRLHAAFVGKYIYGAYMRRAHKFTFSSGSSATREWTNDFRYIYTYAYIIRSCDLLQY